MHYYTLAFFLVLCLPCVAAQMKKILQEACNGELEASVARVGAEEDMDDAMYMAGILHIRSTFALLLEADPAKAVALHRQGKALSATKVPPLAKLHIDGKHCGGLGDLYYISGTPLNMTLRVTGSEPGIMSLVPLSHCRHTLSLPIPHL